MLKIANVKGRVPGNVVHEHPTIQSLADYMVSAILNSDVAYTPGSATYSLKMSELVDRYSVTREHFKISARTKSQKVDTVTPLPDASDYVVLTGSTGNLGTYILVQLLQRPTVKRIYCLNRFKGENTLDRQISAFRSKNLDESLFRTALNDRLQFHDVDLSHPKLNFPDNVYTEVHHSTYILIILLIDQKDR